MAMKKWKVDAGNSGTGPVGFVVYDLLAPTKEAALDKLRKTFALPDEIEGHGEDDDENRTLVRVYFNADKLTLKDIYEDDDDDEGDDEDESEENK
jgi:hypothetical protein